MIWKFDCYLSTTVTHNWLHLTKSSIYRIINSPRINEFPLINHPTKPIYDVCIANIEKKNSSTYVVYMWVPYGPIFTSLNAKAQRRERRRRQRIKHSRKHTFEWRRSKFVCAMECDLLEIYIYMNIMLWGKRKSCVEAFDANIIRPTINPTRHYRKLRRY